MDERTPRLLQALNDLNGSPTAQGSGGSSLQPLASSPQLLGHVSLVGAGPGDPGLLTRRALSRLRAADLVLFDALIDDRILRYARKAQRFFVGKRAGRRAMSEDAIHALMIRAARRGRRVVRLKGGDPFVFGRGGEEALALRRAGVSFDVVPGVTSAVAAPALAGIPVTFRGVASGFYVVSGHDEAAFAAAIRATQAAGTTLVVLMGMGRASALAEILLAHGWPRGSAAAIIIDASHPEQRVWRGTLGDLAGGDGVSALGAQAARDHGAGTIVIGDVVAIADAAETGTERIYVTSR
jgi:uroporphyrin-III C-methyltransferase/precorrin-2 dehydrogenase/sirohydrochlorin ferrochelatase